MTADNERPRRGAAHWGDTQRVNVSRHSTPATGVPVEVDDDLTPTPQLVERIAAKIQGQISPQEQQLTDAIAEVLSESLIRRVSLQHRQHTDQLLSLSSRAPVLASDQINSRLDELESWRMRMTGFADGNGKIGELARRVDTLRHDVGSELECFEVRQAAQTVKAIKRYMITAIATAAISVGGSAWTLVKSRDESTRRNAQLEYRLEQAERQLERLWQQPRGIP